MSTIPLLERAIDQKLVRLKELNQRDDFSEAESVEVDQLKEQLTADQDKLEQRKWLASLEVESAKPLPTDYADARAQYSIRKAVLAMNGDSNVDASLEKEVSQQITADSGKSPSKGMWCPTERVTHAVTTTTPSGGAGSNLISTEHLTGQYINLLRPSRLTSIPFTRLSSKGDVAIPKAKADITSAKFLGESENLTSSDGEFESVTCSPTKYGAMSEFSALLLAQSDPSIDTLLAQSLSEKLQRIYDRVCIYGKQVGVTAGDTRTGYGGSGATWTIGDWTGLVGSTDKQFAGITQGIDPTALTGNNGKSLSVSDIERLMAELDKEELPEDGRWVLLSAPLARKLSVTLEFSSSGSMPIFRGGRVRDYNTLVTNLIPSNRKKGTATALSDLIVVHAPSYGLVDFYGGLELMTNQYSQFASGNIQIRAMGFVGSFKKYDALAEWYNVCETVIS